MAPNIRLIGALCLLAFAIQAFLNGTVQDWWGGWAFGGRRFLSCTVYFGLGAALLVDWVVAFALRHTRAITQAAIVLLIAVFAGFNIGLADDYLHSRAKHGGPQSMEPNWLRTVQRSYRAAYHHIGNLGAIPANWLFALRASTAPLHYDFVSGHEVRRGDRLSFVDPHVGLSGFSDPILHAGRRCRSLAQPSGRFVLTLRRKSAMHIEIEGAAIDSSVRVVVTMNGESITSLNLAASWTKHRFEIPASATRAGMNYGEMRQSREDGRPAQSVWTTLELLR